MILVIGGKGAGKYAYTCNTLGFAPAQIGDAKISGFDAVYNLQDYIRAERPADLEQLADTLAEKSVVVCDEVGCGVVPIDREEREYRERVGRLCCLLAARANKVVRLVCGIPVLLKGEE